MGRTFSLIRLPWPTSPLVHTPFFGLNVSPGQAQAEKVKIIHRKKGHLFSGYDEFSEFEQTLSQCQKSYLRTFVLTHELGHHQLFQKDSVWNPSLSPEGKSVLPHVSDYIQNYFCQNVPDQTNVFSWVHELVADGFAALVLLKEYGHDPQAVEMLKGFNQIRQKVWSQIQEKEQDQWVHQCLTDESMGEDIVEKATDGLNMIRHTPYWVHDFVSNLIEHHQEWDQIPQDQILDEVHRRACDAVLDRFQQPAHTWMNMERMQAQIDTFKSKVPSSSHHDVAERWMRKRSQRSMLDELETYMAASEHPFKKYLYDVVKKGITQAWEDSPTPTWIMPKGCVGTLKTFLELHQDVFKQVIGDVSSNEWKALHVHEVWHQEHAFRLGPFARFSKRPEELLMENLFDIDRALLTEAKPVPGSVPSDVMQNGSEKLNASEGLKSYSYIHDWYTLFKKEEKAVLEECRAHQAHLFLEIQDKCVQRLEQRRIESVQTSSVESSWNAKRSMKPMG